MDFTLTTDLAGVDWEGMKRALAEDNFDNGRSPAQLRRSFENSHACCLAYADGRLIGTARVLSDGVCNAYLVDVWTLTAHRRQGVARAMIERILEGLPGQHVALFTDEAPEFYRRIGFVPRGTTFERVVGRWLDNDSGP